MKKIAKEKKVEFKTISSASALEKKVASLEKKMRLLEKKVSGHENDRSIWLPPKPWHTDKAGDTKIGNAWQNDSNTSEAK